MEAMQVEQGGDGPRQSPRSEQETPRVHKFVIAKFAAASAGVFLFVLILIFALRSGGGGDDKSGGGAPGNPEDVTSPEAESREAHEEAKRRVGAALQEFKAQRHPSPAGGWETAIVYSILVDRFDNQVFANDDRNRMQWEVEAREKGDFSQLGKMRHGGDLKGLQLRLPYIKDLGANTILVSPVLSHNGHYDGSCPTDPTRIDSGFGSKEEFRELVAEAHKLEIRVVMDIVVNHLCDPNVHYKEPRKAGDDKVRQCSSALMGVYGKGDAKVDEGLQLELELNTASYAGFRRRPDFFNRCGPGTDLQLNSNEEVALFGDVGPEMFDFNTSNSDWQDLFVNIHSFWIAYADIDGFHCRGAEHVTEDFLAYFSTSLRRFAREKAGKDNFLMVGDVEGEDWAAKRLGVMKQDGQGQKLKKMLQKLNAEHPGFSTVHNLPQNSLLRGQLTGDSDENALRDYYDEDAPALVQQLAPKCVDQGNCGAVLAKFWTEIERAPLPRFASAVEDAPEGFSEVGLAMMLLAPGQPVINYGQEQGFNGRCPEGGAEGVACSSAEPLERSRQDMFEAGGWRLGSSVDKINGLAKVTSAAPEKSSGAWERDPMLDRSHELYSLTRGLIRLRLSCPAILSGITVVRDVEEHRKGGAIALSRVLKGDKGHAMEIIVVVNPHAGEAEFRRIPCDPDINEEMIDYDEVRSQLVERDDELEESEEDHVRYEHGHCYLVFPGHGLKVPGYSFKVLVRKDQLAKEREDGLPLRLCRPTPGEEQEPGGGEGGDKPADGQKPDDEHKPADGKTPSDGPCSGDGPKPEGQSWSSWARERLPCAVKDFERADAKRMPSPLTWESSVVYSILVDRFNNGNRANDEANLLDWDRTARDSRDFKDVSLMRHGGDLEGITKRLSYIKLLGANTILLSPVLKHDGFYDGSCTTDPTMIDPGFGSKEEFRELVTVAHAAGLRVVMDIVVNHLCGKKMKYKRAREEGAESIGQCARELLDAHLQGQGGVETYGLQLGMEFSEGSFGPFSDAAFFNRCGPGTEYQIQNDDPMVLFADMKKNVFDYNTRDTLWQELFTNVHKWWIAYADIDGFHCGDAEHVTEDFLAYFSTETRDFAASLGKTNFFVVGEVTGKNEWAVRRVGAMNDAMTADPSALGETVHPIKGKTLEKMLEKLEEKYTKQRFGKPGLNAVRNWAQSSLLRIELKGDEVAERVAEYFGESSEEMSDLASQLAPTCKSQKDCTATLPQFWTEMENIYLTRFAADQPNAPKFDEVGLAVLLLAPGQPIINYGQEQGFNGACPEGAGEDCTDASEMAKWSQDMFLGGPWRLGSSVTAVNKLAHIGRFDPQVIDAHAGDNWEEDQMLQRDHELFKWAQGLIRLRLTCSAILRGATIVRQAHGAEEDGGLAFSRVLRGEGTDAMEVIVVVNPGGKETLFSKIACDPSINQDSNAYVEVRSKESEEHVVRYEDEKHCFLVFAGHGLKVEAFSFKVFVRKDQLREAEPDSQLPNRYCKQEGDVIPAIPPSPRATAASLRGMHS